MAEEHGDPPGPEDDVWTFGSDDPAPGPADDPADGSDGVPPSAIGGRSARMAVGVVLVVLGIVFAFLAFREAGDDETSSRPPVKLAPAAPASNGTADAPASTASTAPLVPTTLPGGVLPEGCGPWDPAFGGRPEPVSGVAIFVDGDGWHVELGPDGPPVVTGTVAGQATPYVSTEPPGPGVQLLADPANSTVSFRLVAGGAPVGFIFGADCAHKQLTFDVKDDAGAPLDPALVHIGRGGTASALPVVAQRTSVDG